MFQKKKQEHLDSELSDKSIAPRTSHTAERTTLSNPEGPLYDLMPLYAIGAAYSKVRDLVDIAGPTVSQNKNGI